MWILPFLWTQTSHADVNQMQVVLKIDDSVHTRLESPMLQIQDRLQIPLLETASGIWQGSDTIPRSNSLNFCILERDIQLICPSLDQVPNQDVVAFSFETQAGTPILEKVGPDPIQQAPAVEEDKSPGEGTGTPTPEVGDSIDIILFVDDRSLSRLKEPVLSIDPGDGIPLALSDDGQLEGDSPGDGIWMARFSSRRTEFLILRITDGGVGVGKRQVFLPSSDQAEIRLVTTQTGDGLDLVTEATSGGSVGGPEGTVGAGSGGRLAHVLWIMIALFAVLFTYLRQVVWRTWTGEVKPALDRVSPDSEQGGPS